MGGVTDRRLHRHARFRYALGLTCVFAYAATAGPEPHAPAATSGSALKLEESPPSRVLYLEEGGGLITPVAKPQPGSVRPPPLPTRDAKVPTPRPPIARHLPTASKSGIGRGGVPSHNFVHYLIFPARRPIVPFPNFRTLYLPWQFLESGVSRI